MSGGRSGTLVAALLALSLVPGSPARSQDGSTLKKEMVGQWELATTERSKTCVVTLKGDAIARFKPLARMLGPRAITE